MFFDAIEELEISFFIIKDNTIVDCNKNAINLFGYQNKEDIIGLKPFNLSPLRQDDGTNSIKKGQTLINKTYHKKNVNFMWRHKKKNDDTFLAYINMIGINDIIFSLITNIDEAKKIEDKIEEQDQLYKYLFKYNTNIIYLADLKSEYIVDANPAATKFYGYDLEQLKKKKYYDLTINNKQDVQKNIKLIEENKGHLLTSKHKLANGEIRDVEINSFIITLDNKQLLFVMVRDVTERIKQNLIIDTFITQSPYPIAVLDNEQRVLNINDKFTETFQYSRDELLGENLNDLVTTLEYRKELSDQVERIFTKNFVRVKTLRKRKDNSLINVEIVAIPITYNKKIIGAYVHYIDITEKTKVQHQLELFKQVLENSNEGILITDRFGYIEWVNHTFTKITGYKLNEIKGNTPRILKSNLQNKHFYDNMWNHILEDNHWQGEIWNKNKNGDIFPEWLRIDAIRNKNEITNFVGIFRDLSEMKTTNQKIRILSQKDVLTGLYNRTYFTENLERLLTRDMQGITSIIFIDLNHFKEINDTLGHVAGDKFLIELSRRFQKHLSDNSLIARYGGDEFVILLKGYKSKRKIFDFAKNLASIIKEPFIYENNFLQTSASMGISLYPQDGKTSDELIQNADIAMYVAKDNLEKKIVFYSEKMRKSIDERYKIANLLRDAINKKAYTLLYEPVYDLKTKKITGAEMRLSWNNSQLKAYSQKKYLDVAIQTGQINEIFDFMFNELCSNLMLVRDFQIPISINVSTHQLEQTQFSAHVKNKLKTYPINPQNIIFEFADDNIKSASHRVNRNINALLKSGFSFTLDNFGKEHSSIAQLKQYHIKNIKIVKDLLHSNKLDYQNELIRLYRLITKEMNITLTAKGVHNEELLEYIKEFDFDYAQGNYFTKPIRFKELIKKTHE